jgi:hypothetical protein
MRTRQELLNKLEDLEKNHCHACQAYTISEKCKKCPIDKEMKRIGRDLLKSNPRRDKTIKDILAKRKDMTKSEVKILIDLEVSRDVIRKAMGIESDDFKKMMTAWGFRTERRKRTELQLTVIEYQKLKEKGLPDTVIREQKCISNRILNKFKEKNGLSRKKG